METLTLFIEDLYARELGADIFQEVTNVSINNKNFNSLTISGARLHEVLFENVTFNNCTFYGTNIDNCLFIDCRFVNCSFQFSDISNCNFEASSIENCNLGFTSMKNIESHTFLKSTILKDLTKTISLDEFFLLAA